ncbi:MAG TPA: hypothetical protein VFG68_17975 [Fimbriiglobus sp.]|nr:hypothetical protein [Fimbriiglobus sp.]
MVTLYVAGQPVGTWAEAEKLFAEAAKTQAVEFRDEHGRVIATSVPGAEPIIPWEPDVTREEIEDRKAEPGLTFEEVKKRLGWE